MKTIEELKALHPALKEIADFDCYKRATYENFHLALIKWANRWIMPKGRLYEDSVVMFWDTPNEIEL